ncbi:nitroreductase/quinone reductase family protein [Streptacidiphilus sp. N1-12]|uniref:Nitroreductase/quinone reductase family protein n=2 Tax=Streptacidiphilus alkalitolerans TaxID=3342712 RepID=A0ABV6X2F2_9ACTN
MGQRRTLVARLAVPANAAVSALVSSPRWGRLVGRSFAVITYTGRRSGRTVSTPVGYRRKGDVVTIAVMMPDAKTWWRNFTGDGGPMTLRLDGTERHGQALARRDDRGRVAVSVQLDSA